MKDAWQRLLRGSGLLVLVAALITGILVLQGVSIYRSYQSAWALAIRSTENALQTLGDQIERNLGIIDLSLTGLQNAITMEGLETLPVSVRHTLLFDRAGSVRFLGSLLALDKNGNIRFDSSSAKPRSGNFSDREHFRVHISPNDDLFISHPFLSRLRGDGPTIALSRRLSAPDGGFLGVAAAGLRVAYFNDLFGKLDLGTESVIRVVNTDGIVMASQPEARGGDISPDISGSALFKHIMDRTARSFLYTSPLDGIERYYVKRRLGEFPLVLVIGISTADVLDEWKTQSMIDILLVLVDGVFIILLFVALRRALNKSQQMEAHMQSIAITDELTGLPNRRALDAALDREIRRAAREKLPLSILMIDIDHFKSVNDQYGHSVGDEVLHRVGQMIATACRRAGDLAARYGGEEFILLLPSTTPEDARKVAENVRMDILQMAPSSSVPDMRPVSVSIGVASSTAGAPLSCDDVLKRADQALYAAKNAGRNRVM